MSRKIKHIDIDADPRVYRCPFVISMDAREKAPWTFTGLKTDAADGKRDIVVERNWQTLPTGDYSILGMHNEVAVERKSLEDLYGTLGSGRDRFKAELERLSCMKFAAVVIESDLQTIMTAPPMHSRMKPKNIVRTMIAWQVRWPSVPWWFAGTRRNAEMICFRMLEKFYTQTLRA